MKLIERMKNMVKRWLEIQPAQDRSIAIRETASFDTNCMRNRIWYRGDASEIEQLFKALRDDSVGRARFWAAAPETEDVRKAHSGLPGILVDTLAYLVKADLNEVEFEGATQETAQSIWADMAKDSDFTEQVGMAVAEVLAVGDGAFKLSIDPGVSEYPLLEFWGADRVSYVRRHGRVCGVVFRSHYAAGNVTYRLEETYEVGSVTYALYDGEKQVPLARVPELADYKPVEYDAPFSMAVPLFVYKSQKYAGRGRSIFDSKTDAFDAHDEVISQWIDAVRAGRVAKYIPEDMIPHDENGKLMSVDSFGAKFVKVGTKVGENAENRIDTIQPDIKYDAFLQSYCTTLDMCLHGVMSPATLGIDVGKMASADAQREKKDVTGYTRNAITDALEKVLPRVVSAMLMAYDVQRGRTVGVYEPRVSFGEYGAPDFDSRVNTIGAAASADIMSVEAQVEELWGASKDDAWKEEEIGRILRQRGIETMEEPGLGGQQALSPDLLPPGAADEV